MREREILALVGRGVAMSAIAEQLGISLATVRKHRENLMRKLGLHSTADIMLYDLAQRVKKMRAQPPKAKAAKSPGSKQKSRGAGSRKVDATRVTTRVTKQ
jgi:DNA-binding CsgD family transcriptional regulator